MVTAKHLKTDTGRDASDRDNLGYRIRCGIMIRVNIKIQ